MGIGWCTYGLRTHMRPSVHMELKSTTIMLTLFKCYFARNFADFTEPPPPVNCVATTNRVTSPLPSAVLQPSQLVLSRIPLNLLPIDRCSKPDISVNETYYVTPQGQTNTSRIFGNSFELLVNTVELIAKCFVLGLIVGTSQISSINGFLDLEK
jgi:hypothetical protein